MRLLVGPFNLDHQTYAELSKGHITINCIKGFGVINKKRIPALVLLSSILLNLTGSGYLVNCPSTSTEATL